MPAWILRKLWRILRMSNKLTKNKLDLLIEDVLNEKINISVDRGGNVVKKDIFGRVPRNISIDDIRDLADVDKNVDSLSDKDFEKAFKKQDASDEEHDIAMNIRNVINNKYSTESPIAGDVNAIYNKAFGIKKPKDDQDYERNLGNIIEAPLNALLANKDFKKYLGIPVAKGRYYQSFSDPIIEFFNQVEAEHKLKYSSFDRSDVVKLVATKNPKLAAALTITGVNDTLSKYNLAILQKMSSNQKLSAVNSVNPYLEQAQLAQLNIDVKDFDKSSEALPTSSDGTSNVRRGEPKAFGDIEVTYGNISPSSGFKEIAKGLRQVNLQVDPSVIATVDAIPGEGMISKLMSLSEFLGDIDNNLKGNDICRAPASMVRMLGFLSDMVTEYESASAGTVFETFLAMMGKGFIVGGESGAADIITFSNGSPIYYSAKLYASENIGQSDQADIGFTSVIKQAAKEDSKQGLIYLIGYKTDSKIEDLKPENAPEGSQSTTQWIGALGQAKNPKAIAILALRLPTGDICRAPAGALQISVLKSDGKEYGVLAQIKGNAILKESQSSNFAEITREAITKGYLLGYIPIFHEIEETTRQITKSSAKVINKKITDFGSEALNMLRASFGNIKEMQLLSQEHSAKFDNMSAQENGEYISKIQTQYSGFKTNYNNVLGSLTDKGDKKITEKKQTKSLKDLDKLIERVILNKMNKL